MEEVSLIPKLRFPEFKDELSTVKLGSIASFSKGKGISKSQVERDGVLECIRYGELYTEYSEVIDKVVSKTNVSAKELVLSSANDVIIPASGETQIDIATASCVLREGVALGGDLNIIKSPVNGVYLAYYLNNAKKSEIASLSQGISVVHLYASQLKSLLLNLHPQEEQQKIATFLTAVDERIQLLQDKKTKLEAYKKGVMQKLFSQEIRFKDENGNPFPDWQVKKLGELGVFVSGVGFSNSEQGGAKGVPFLKVSDMNLVGNEKEITTANNYVSQEQIERLKYKPITKSSVIFAKVGAAIFLERKRIANNFLIDNNMMAFTPKDSISFFKFLFDILRLSKFAQTGALPSYNSGDLKTIKVHLPCPSERKIIAAFLSSIDESIEAVSKEIEGTTTFKKGLLQKMFV